MSKLMIRTNQHYDITLCHSYHYTTIICNKVVCTFIQKYTELYIRLKSYIYTLLYEGVYDC